MVGWRAKARHVFQSSSGGRPHRHVQAEGWVSACLLLLIEETVQPLEFFICSILESRKLYKKLRRNQCSSAGRPSFRLAIVRLLVISIESLCLWLNTIETVKQKPQNICLQVENRHVRKLLLHTYIY